LDGSVTNYSKTADSEWPLRSRFLRHICGKATTGSSPTGSGGPSPRYSCPKCRAKIQKIAVSKGRDMVHDDFIELLDQVRPSVHIQKLFKHIVLREWNNDMKGSQKLIRSIEDELRVIEDKRSRILDLFIENKLTDQQKDGKLSEIEASATSLKLKRAEVSEDLVDKESVIDGVLLFMSDPGKFWNLAPLELKKRIQDTIFPEGLVYDFDKGFGTVKLANSYLLIQKLASEEAKNQTLVVATGISAKASSARSRKNVNTFSLQSLRDL